MGSGVVAAIDCGTNSTRLLVAGPDGTALDRLMTITRLGAGVDRTHALAPVAVERTIGVLRRYRAAMDHHGVERARMIATSAARDATNRAELFDAAHRVVGVEAELLAGEEEGRLSFAGATALLDPTTGPWLVADIGGGSTELAVGPAPGGDRLRPAQVCSLDMGCVRITERFLRHDPPGPEELGAARRFVADELDRAVSRHPDLAGPGVLVGLAGTVAAAASLEQRLKRYDRSRLHHHHLAGPVVTDLLGALAGDDRHQRRRRPGMETERADVIVGGLIVLDGLMRGLGISACLTSEADILDGLAMTML